MKVIRIIKLELWLSFKYIFGRKKEFFISLTSFLAIASVVIGIAVLLLVMAIMNGFNTELKKRLIGLGSHIQIVKFADEHEQLKTEQLLLKNQKVTKIAPFIRKQLIFSLGQENYLITVEGITPEKERQTANLGRYVIKGNLNLKANGILIGQEFAKIFGYHIGDKITLINPKNQKFVVFKVQGIFFTGAYLYDFNLAYINLAFAQRIFEMSNTVSGFKIKISNEDQVKMVKCELAKILDLRYDINTWLDLNKSLFNAMQIERRIMVIILSLLLLLAGFNIATTLMMNVMEKRREIGILKALGFSNQRLKRIFIYQGLFLSCVGIILGLGLGFLLAWQINPIMDVVGNLIGSKLIFSETYYLNKIPVHFDYYYIGLTVLFCFLVSFLASYYPAHKASKLEPIEVLKNE
ncbi:MAG: ABC transporter permease [Candidatus Margulisiibacteriota bacterium]|jgi:lipoprotein-releasing system permease protein